ncbi:MAG: diguanylate cyclase [Clostridiaceae bacterium]
MKKKIIYASILVVVFCFIFISFTNEKSSIDINSKNIEKGLAKITPDRLDGLKTIKLNGTWRFYPNNLLTPEMIENDVDNNYESMYVNVPSDWKKVYKLKKGSNGDGYGTYYMEIQGLEEYNRELAFKLENIYTCYKIYVNGQLVSESGTVGTDRETSIAQYKKGIVPFYNNEEKIKVTIQVSNFQHRSGGIWDAIEFGSLENIMKYRDWIMIIELFLIGSFVFMGLYHIFIYHYLKEYKAALFLGIFCLICSVRLITMGETIIFKIFPYISWESNQKIEYETYYLGLATLVMYVFYLFPGYMKKWIKKFSNIISICFAVIVIFTPARIYSNLNIIFQIVTLIISVYLFYIFWKAAADKMQGALMETVGIITFIIMGLLDILYYNEVIYFGGGRLFAIGLFVFIFIQSIVLSKMFSASFVNNKILATVNHNMYLNIKELNENLEIKIKDRTKELNNMVDKLNIYSSTDQMTGVLNRATGLMMLEKELTLSKQNKNKLSLCFLDINDLKKVNDSLGHKDGDDLIKTSSKIIEETIRKTDIFCRMGGDEFMIIFPQTSKEEAKAIIERSKILMNQQNDKKDKPFNISISFGFSEYSKEMGMDIDDEKLIEIADKEMYENKKKYKNMFQSKAHKL